MRLKHLPDRESSYRFQASLTHPDAPPQVLAEVSYDESDPTSLSIRLDLLGDAGAREAISIYLQARREDQLWIYPKFPALQSVHVTGIRSTTEAFGPTQLLEAVTIEAVGVE